MRFVKTGETLSGSMDMQMVAQEDYSRVQAALICILTLEDNLPAVDRKIRSDDGYYALIFHNYNQTVDLDNWHERMRRNPDAKLAAILNVRSNPETGSLVVRVGKQGGNAPVIDTAGFTVPHAPPPSSSTKRLRQGETAEESSSVLVHEGLLAHAADDLWESIERHYDTSEVLPSDMESVLAIIFSVVTLEKAHPTLDVTIRREHNCYRMTFKGFAEIADWDHWYTCLRLRPDPRIYSIHSLGVNPKTGVLDIVAGMRAVNAPMMNTAAASGGGRKRGRD